MPGEVGMNIAQLAEEEPGTVRSLRLPRVRGSAAVEPRLDRSGRSVCGRVGETGCRQRGPTSRACGQLSGCDLELFCHLASRGHRHTRGPGLGTGRDPLHPGELRDQDSDHFPGTSPQARGGDRRDFPRWKRPSSWARRSEKGRSPWRR